jgi:hypothetical protein
MRMKASTFVRLAAFALAFGVGGCAVQTSTSDGESGEATAVSPSVLGIRDPQAAATSNDQGTQDVTRAGSVAVQNAHHDPSMPQPWDPTVVGAGGSGGGGGGGSGGVGGNGSGAPGGGVERVPDGF